MPCLVVTSRVLRHAFAAGLAVLAVGWSFGAAPASAAAEHIAGCTPETKHAATWEDVNGIADDFEDDIRASPLRHAYTGMAFDQHHKKLEVYFRNHTHDAAVMACAEQLKIAKYVQIHIHQWSYGQLLRALRKVEDALPGLYDSQVFECSYGAADRFDIDIYAKATDHDVARIKQEAKKTHVPFKIHRLKTAAPVPELQ